PSPHILSLLPYTTLFRSRRGLKRQRAGGTLMPAVNNWTIIVSPYNPELRAAKFDCPKCRQSMLTSDPDKAVFVHCGRRDFLTLEDRKSTRLNSSHQIISY